MSVPQPSLQQIAAFDAINGTTTNHTTIINYNIIGGTELIRSSKLYIYSNPGNELICTHVDNTTYSSQTPFHILPINTDPSIIYESGKSSANFTNEKYFSASIQGFTQPNGAGDPSVLSNRVQFWCLDTPSVIMDAVPSRIDTTSYNMSAVYDTLVDDTTIPITNKVARYQFYLFDAASGQQVATSGQIVGSGTPVEGSNTKYSISYNFNGMQDKKSYYSTVTVTSTEGMTVSGAGNDFLIEIEAPSFAKAVVTNHCMEGYITVESNITSITGRTNVPTPIPSLPGEIDLRGNYYLTWEDGVSFPSNNNWTMEIWGRAFDISKYISTEVTNLSWLLKLNNTINFDSISVFITQGYEYGSEELKTRADLIANQGGVKYYAYSNYIDNPVDTDELDVWLRYVDGLFEIQLTIL